MIEPVRNQNHNFIPRIGFKDAIVIFLTAHETENMILMSMGAGAVDYVVKGCPDEELLEQTGGIVQGMSGSPILQDGMLVGAVTHVFVNDPTKGFAIFAENMLKTMDSVAQSLENQQGAA